jgi:hypothetical protein
MSRSTYKETTGLKKNRREKHGLCWALLIESRMPMIKSRIFCAFDLGRRMLQKKGKPFANTNKAENQKNDCNGTETIKKQT